jgi:hypothetical protein
MFGVFSAASKVPTGLSDSAIDGLSNSHRVQNVS